MTKPQSESPRNLRVCHLAATTEGATWMLEQLRELRNCHGCEVTAIIAAGDGLLAGKLAAEGIRTLTFDFDLPLGWRLPLLLFRVRNLSRLFERERFDVVQSHLFNSMVLGRIAAWLADVPVRLAMIAGPYHLEAYTPRWIDADTSWMETAIIGSCQYTVDLYRALGVGADRLHLVYYGPDANKFDPDAVEQLDVRAEFGWPANAPVIGMIAYFYPRLPASSWTPAQLHNVANKRQEDLIRAVPIILAERPSARLLLVGSGWGPKGKLQLDEMKSLAAALGVQHAVAFTGYRPDVNQILLGLDVSVQASLSENLGGTIETLLMRRPIVATRVGGMVDSVRDAVTGLLVPPLDPSALSAAVLRLLRDPPWAHSLAVEGRNLMLSRFTLGTTVDDLMGIYRQRLAMVQEQGGFLGFSRPRQWRRRLSAIPVCLYLGARLCWDLLYPRLGNLWRKLRHALAR